MTGENTTPDLNLAGYLITRETVRVMAATLKAMPLDRSTLASEMIVQALVLACPTLSEDAAREQVIGFWNTLAANLKTAASAKASIKSAGVIQFPSPANDPAPPAGGGVS